MQEMRVWSLSGEDPLEKDMATHSSILAWRIPWTEEPGNGPWGCKELDMTEVTEHAPWPHLNLVISLKILSPMTVTFWSTGLWTSMHSLHMKSWKDTCQSLQPWQFQRSLKTPLTETSPFWGVGVSRSGLLDLVGGSWPGGPLSGSTLHSLDPEQTCRPAAKARTSAQPQSEGWVSTGVTAEGPAGRIRGCKTVAAVCSVGSGEPCSLQTWAVSTWLDELPTPWSLSACTYKTGISSTYFSDGRDKEVMHVQYLAQGLLKGQLCNTGQMKSDSHNHNNNNMRC